MVETDLMTGKFMHVLDLGVLLTSSSAPHVNDSVQWASVLQEMYRGPQNQVWEAGLDEMRCLCSTLQAYGTSIIDGI